MHEVKLYFMFLFNTVNEDADRTLEIPQIPPVVPLQKGKYSLGRDAISFQVTLMYM